MASIYLCNVTGTGVSTEAPYRPSGFDGRPFVLLMLEPTRLKALVLSSDDTVTGVGINNLITAASVAALRALASSTNPTAAKRTAINAWLAGAGFTQLTAAQVTWADCVQYVAQQVNPVADLSATTV